MMVLAIKINDSFLVCNFLKDGFCTPYRPNRKSNGGEILLYVREDIPSSSASSEETPIDAFYMELDLHQVKWLKNCSYSNYKNFISSHLNALCKTLDLYSPKYGKIVLLGELNNAVDKQYSFFNSCSLIKQ